jgi:hypothetical protein
MVPLSYFNPKILPAFLFQLRQHLCAKFNKLIAQNRAGIEASDVKP